ncbi:hypothetical protein [Synechococcus sp. C9]|jgi:hypothetical protein|uniref:hypothetical protein n=1 Tax=Synechococcus sp. C9 TaxID=102119 RepID=UPI001FF5923E|nr:hypothetical protein [Synechococcus sp. C9]WAS04494.1 hypothetical protein LQF76_10730 [Gloeomargaritales cyanobacterium VI4D9]
MVPSIPQTPEEFQALRLQPPSPDRIALAIAGVVGLGRKAGQSLAELQAQILAEDGLLEPATRSWLSQLIAQAWELTPPEAPGSCSG